jgi:hypothetical protein
MQQVFMPAKDDRGRTPPRRFVSCMPKASALRLSPIQLSIGRASVYRATDSPR